MGFIERLTCQHDYKIINETHRNVFLGPIDGWIRVEQRYELYCTKCKRRRWVGEVEAKSLMEISKLEKTPRKN